MPRPLPPGTKLAVPPMHPDIPAEVVAKVHDFINKRMFVEAVGLAEEAEDLRRRGVYFERQTGLPLPEPSEIVTVPAA